MVFPQPCVLYFRALVIRTPEEMKEAGNNYYKQQNYNEALNCYTQAISKLYIPYGFFDASEEKEAYLMIILGNF